MGFVDVCGDVEYDATRRPSESCHANILILLATAIPNATVTWWFKGKEIGRSTGDLDKNFEIKGHGGRGTPTSTLTVTPLRSDYYGFYKCKAENPHGIAFHEIELEEAREPSRIQQAIIDKTTATTLQFRFVPPTDTGGLPVDAYAVEYKNTKSDWISAKRRVWPASKNKIYYLHSKSSHFRHGLNRTDSSKNLLNVM